jgi:hypothetical protein
MRRITGMVVLFVGIFSAQASAQRYAVFPQFAAGNGWSCSLFFNNPLLNSIGSIKVFFYDNAGHPINVPTNIGTGNKFDFPLAAGGTKVIKLLSTASVPEGYIVVQYPYAWAVVRASEIFRYEQNGVVMAEVGVPQLEQANHLSFPVEINSSEGITTAVALANPVEFNSQIPVTQTVIMSLIQTNGTVKAITKLPLLPGQHLSGYLNDQLFFAGLDNFVGTVSISSPLGIGVLALRQDKQAFGGIATDYGPVMAPFIFNGTSVPLQEPNDTFTQAVAINSSTVLSGAIEKSGDIDLVKFTGVKDGILTVRALPATNSWLPTLEVYDDNFNMIAQNDSSGYFPGLVVSNQSYIQMVLPTNGTYYIAVKSRWGSWGLDIAYSLQITLP